MPQELQWISEATKIGAYGLLILAVVGGFRGWYVWRWIYDVQVGETAKALADRDYWRGKYLDVVEVSHVVTEQLVGVARRS